MALAFITINEIELDAIQQRLGAVLDTYRGRSSAQSDIDTLQLAKSPECPDLSASAEFQELSDGYEPASVDFVFAHPQAGNVRLRVSTVNGSIWFRTAVTEDIIDYVFDVVRQVKGLP